MSCNNSERRKELATPVESPCVRNCCLNDSDICVGCFRSLAEITRWSIVDDEAKMRILAQAAERRSQMRPKSEMGGDDINK